MDYIERLERVRRSLGEHELDALLVTNLTNVRYLTGFSGTNGQVLIADSGAWFLTDPRYAARAGDLVTGAEIVIYTNGLAPTASERLSALKIERLGIEARTVTVADRDDLAEKLPSQLVPVRNVVEELRRTKDPEEVAALTAAVRVADEAFSWALERLSPGATEREVALDLEVRMRTTGADDVSFEPIVGSGPLSAHIHHSPSDRTFEKGDLVLMDFGARLDGYCSDMTRTIVLGPATDEQRRQYEIVLAAQQAGIDAARAGVKGVDVDGAARAVVVEAGEGDNFPHSLGHGVGLDIHETPALRLSDEPLKAGEVVTIEPGVYVIGTGGVRIEDCVLIEEDGARVLGSAPKDTLIEL
ncbi:MAG: M24 family metallopeptidase [Actinomycetota bacterium]